MSRKAKVSDEIDLSLISRAIPAQTNTVSKTWIYDNYNINTSTDSTSSIFFNITNNITYQNYEQIIYSSDLSIGFDNFLRVMEKAFNLEKNYSLNLELGSGFITLHFLVSFDGFYNVSESIIIKEKTFSEDKKLTIKITELESRIRELETEEIIFGYDSSTHGSMIKLRKSIDTLDFRQWVDPKFKWFGNVWEFNNLKFLKKIIIGSGQFYYNFPITNTITFNGTDINSISYINTSNGNVRPNLTYTNIPNLFDNQQVYLPNVTEIVIYSTSVLANYDPVRFRSLPKLSKVVFEGFGNTQLITFDFVRNNNIKHIVYSNCLNVHQLDLIKNHFETNNLRIEVKK
jgi:hypothetical protein